MHSWTGNIAASVHTSSNMLLTESRHGCDALSNKPTQPEWSHRHRVAECQRAAQGTFLIRQSYTIQILAPTDGDVTKHTPGPDKAKPGRTG